MGQGDLNDVLQNWGFGTGPQPLVAAQVPEPACLVLLCVSGMAIIRRRSP